MADVGSKMNDFADTAAVLDQLDLIITVDTSIEHLCWCYGAAGLGLSAICTRLEMVARPK